MSILKNLADRAQSRRGIPTRKRVGALDRFGKQAYRELEAMFFSGGPSGLAMPTGVRQPAGVGIAQASRDAAVFFRDHAQEFHRAFDAGYTATEAARRIGRAHGVRFFR